MTIGPADARKFNPTAYIFLFLITELKSLADQLFYIFDKEMLEIHEIPETGHFGFQLFHQKFIYLG